MQQIEAADFLLQEMAPAGRAAVNKAIHRKTFSSAARSSFVVSGRLFRITAGKSAGAARQVFCSFFFLVGGGFCLLCGES